MISLVKVRHEDNGPTGGQPIGLPIPRHWFTTYKDNAGTLCDTCLGWSNDYRHNYHREIRRTWLTRVT
jgi:hypothetical protein